MNKSDWNSYIVAILKNYSFLTKSIFFAAVQIDPDLWNRISGWGPDLELEGENTLKIKIWIMKASEGDASYGYRSLYTSSEM